MLMSKTQPTVAAASVSAGSAVTVAKTSSSPILRSATSKFIKNCQHSPIFSIVAGVSCSTGAPASLDDNNSLFEVANLLTGLGSTAPFLIASQNSHNPSVSNTLRNSGEDNSDYYKKLKTEDPAFKSVYSDATKENSVARILNFQQHSKDINLSPDPLLGISSLTPGIPNLGNTCFVNALLQVQISDLFKKDAVPGQYAVSYSSVLDSSIPISCVVTKNYCCIRTGLGKSGSNL